MNLQHHNKNIPGPSLEEVLSIRFHTHVKFMQLNTSISSYMSTEIPFLQAAVMAWIWNAPYRLMVNAWSQLVVLFWEMVELQEMELRGRRQQVTSSPPLSASCLSWGKQFPLHHLISEDVYSHLRPKVMEQPIIKNEFFLPQALSQQCKSNWYGSYGKILLYTQKKYGILYYNIQCIFSNI